MAIPPLDLSLSTSSSASSSSGLDNFGGHGGGWTGDISIGSGGQDSWISGLVRDLAIGVAVALAAKYLWGKLR